MLPHAFRTFRLRIFLLLRRIFFRLVPTVPRDCSHARYYPDMYAPLATDLRNLGSFNVDLALGAFFRSVCGSGPTSGVLLSIPQVPGSADGRASLALE